MSSCSCCNSNNNPSEEQYLYRKLKGVSKFTGFIKKHDQIIWIGKDEKSHRIIDQTNEKDCQFFLTRMRQYDR